MILLLVALLTVVSALAQFPPQPPVYRLPDTIKPLSYSLRLEPHLENDTCDGAVMIGFMTAANPSKSLDSVTLHLGRDMTVNEGMVMIVDDKGSGIMPGKIEYDTDNTLIKVTLRDGVMLQPNSMYMITFQFTTFMNTYPSGLFTGVYNVTSKSKYIAANFRPTHARDVFPSFDEPQFKVNVTLQVRRPNSYKAFSTAPLANSSEPDANNMVLDIFQPTQPISIHSLGLFVVDTAEFETVLTSSNVTLIAPPDTTTLSDIPYLNTLLQNINNTLGVFPVGPLNLVVLPDLIYTSFATFGFVFASPEVYSGSAMLTMKRGMLTRHLTEDFLRQFLEFSKTPQWWSDLWLSESIGAFLAMSLLPEPTMKDWQRAMIRSGGFSADLSNNSAPLVNNQLLSRIDIENVISNKTIRNQGLSVLAMWNNTLPENIVNKTIFDYLNNETLSKAQITSTADFLWQLGENLRNDKTYDVSPAIDQLPYWVNSSGYPVVSMWPQSAATVELVQTPGCSSEGVPNTSTSPLWPISVSFTQQTSTNWTNYRQGVWLLKPTLNISTGYNGSEWVIMNLESAPYRVDYKDSWPQIIMALNASDSSGIPADVRVMLREDALSLAFSGCQRFTVAMAALSATRLDTLDWVPVVSAFDILTARIGDDWNSMTQLEMYAATLFTPELLAALDIRDGANHPELRTARLLLTPWLCKFNLGSCREATAQVFGQMQSGMLPMIDINDLENILCYGSKYSNATMVDSLLSAYADAAANGSSMARSLLTIGLGCLTDPSSVQKVLTTIVAGPTEAMKLEKSSTNWLIKGLTNSASRSGIKISADTAGGIAIDDASKIMIGLASSVENSAVMVDFVSSHATDIQTMLGVKELSSIIKTLGKFRVDLSKLQSLSDPSLMVDPYVKLSAVESVSLANLSASWWSMYAADLQAALPELPQNTTLPPPGTTPGSGSGANPMTTIVSLIAAAVIVPRLSL